MTHIKPLLTIAIVSLASFAMAQSESVEQIYERYDQIMDSEEPDTAAIRVLIEDWEKVTSDDPDLMKAQIIYEMTKNMQEQGSSAELKGIIKPELFDNARQLAEVAIAKYPDRLDLRELIISLFFMTQQNGKALESLLELIDHSKTINMNWLREHNSPLPYDGSEEFEGFMFQEFNHFCESGDFQNALALADSLVIAFPKSFLFHAFLATAHNELGNNEQAINEFLLMEKAQPKDESIIISLIQLFVKTNNKDKAKEYCEKLVVINDFYAQTAEFFMGSFETITVDFDEIKEYMKSHEDEYRKIEMKFKGGEAGMSLRDLSILYFGHALTPECTSTKLWDINADSLARNGKFEELLSACEETLKKHPASIAANFYAGISAEQLGNFTAGLYFLKCQQLARMITKSADSLNNLGGKDESEKAEDKFDDTKYYKILWRADEDVFVDFLLDKKEKGKTLFFSQPVYFIEKTVK